MFGIARRKTRSELVKAELSESFDHLMQAATHAASGVGATVGPRVNAAMGYVSPATGKVKDAATSSWASTMAAVAPLALAAAEGARQAGGVARKAKSTNLKAMRKKESHMSRKRWPMLAGLLAGGTVVGAAGAMVMRRRKQQQWDEYDPGRALESTRDDAGSMMASVGDDPLRNSSMAPAMDKSTNAAGDQMSPSAGAPADSVKQKVENTADNAKADGVLSNASSPSGNGRS